MAETSAQTNVQYLSMEGLQLYDSLIKAKIAADIKSGEYDDTTLKAKIAANESAIAAAKSEAILTAAIDASAKADKALEDAKAYADGLGEVTYVPITEDEINSLFTVTE